ncbi:putative DEAD/DEAH box helicase [Pyronema domesticum]|nr:putative DEAD/DEAH box helicase [Pyronema domesticum]KAI5788571.1 putative DEAD/DEAH box helicase [Pyronema domesticum]
MPPPKKSSAPAKKPPAAAPPAPAPSAKKNAVPAANAKNSAAATKNGTQPPEGPKTPTINEIIGGKSWTGKLPVALFYEHCVRMGWEKPNYENPRKEAGGFVMTVHIGQRNARTGEIEKVSFRPPAELPCIPQPTALEARHVCATYALHRVSNMKNIQHMLPPNHKRMWHSLEEIRKTESSTGKAWRYEADPFAVQREHQAVRLKQEQVKEAQKNGAKPPSMAVTGKMRGWDTVPQVDMARERRRETEDLIKKYHVWNVRGVEISAKTRDAIVAELVELGFRKSHAEEACDWAKDREEALEWLLIHVPEDDLPSRFIPENYSAGITMASVGELSAEYAIKRLSACGYGMDLVREVMQRNSLKEDRAAEALMQMLVYGVQRSPDGPLEEDLISFDDDDLWAEEVPSLEAIYGEERFKIVSPKMIRITLEMQGQGKTKLPKIILEVSKPTSYPGSLKYPDTIPTFAIPAIEGEGKLPAYARLSITRQVAAFAEDLVGEQMIFTIVDWLENEIPRIVDNPGLLRDLATAVTGSDEQHNVPTRKKKRNNYHKKGPIHYTPGSPESIKILEEHEKRLKTPAQQKMISARQKLPAWQLQDDIVKAVNTSQVVIISGETGSGKSTQSVQFVLDDLIKRKLGAIANIVCTQPRRISAIGLADRVSDERCQEVGREIGYAIRGESKQTRGITKCTFMTTGVLLRRMQMGDTLDDVSHIVIDEVHERSLDTDMLLVLVKRIISKRKDLKIILMSATLDADVFSEYFGGDKQVAKVKIEGRTFPVTDYYLENIVHLTGFTGGGRIQQNHEMQENEGMDEMDPITRSIVRGLGDRLNYNLIATTVKFIHDRMAGKPGSILIFLPGTMEISRCIDAIRSLPAGANTYHALPLHASLHPTDQRKVFPPAPEGLRKIICATNVAETSITIEDVVAVIDTGKVKETSYDAQNNVVKLQEQWVSKAAAKQRRGRAGRVRAGDCYKLFTKGTETHKMPERPEPEMKRVPLEQTCLSVKAMGIKDVRSFLAAAISPPNTAAVEGALTLLEKMGAVVDEELSALGRNMAMIPTDLRCSKLMVYGVLFGCVDPVLTIASILTVRSPFISPPDKRDESKAIRNKFAANQGDLIADCRAWQQWAEIRTTSNIREAREWCMENYINFNTMVDISSNRSQYMNALRDTGFLPHFTGFDARIGAAPLPEEMNRNSDNYILIRALIASAFTPQIARIQMPEQKFASSHTGAMAIDPEARTIKYFTYDNGRVFLHPSSTLFGAQSFPGNAGFMAYFNKMETNKINIREVTPVNTYSLLLFGGKVEVDTLGRGITVDGWIRLRGWGRIGILVQRLRAMLDNALEGMVDNPDTTRLLTGSNVQVVDCTVKLIEGDGT